MSKPALNPRDFNNPPKRPRAPHVLYIHKRAVLIRESDPSLSPFESAQKAIAEWKSLSEEDKRPYIEKARIDKERYKKERKAWIKRVQNDITSSESTYEGLSSDTSYTTYEESTESTDVESKD